MKGIRRERDVRVAFANQASWSTRLGSPFTGLLMDCLATDLDRSTATGRAILDWEGEPDALGDAVPLRLAGALHGLVRRGSLPALARHYPPAPMPDRETLGKAATGAIAQADAEIAAWLDHPPQTNEVARSVVLYAGFCEIAAHTRMPLSLFEVGASAGLNLLADRYLYRIRNRVYGATGSPVRIATEWRGSIPFGRNVEIVARRGCDRNPLRVSDSSHAERLIAYVWPDQPERIERMQGALGIARAAPPRIDKADAADWVDEIFGAPGRAGAARVLFHSIAYQYFPETTRARIAARMERAGGAATAAAPLAWLSFEQFEDEGPRLTMTLWPGGQQRLLARADPHVRKVQWLAAASARDG